MLHLRGQEARLFVDLAGEPLHRRGYRVAMVEAPLKESLAAAVLQPRRRRRSTGRSSIPMAGSGTLAIEHALAARGIAPGLRRRFGFERWATAEQRRIWQTLLKAARPMAIRAARALPDPGPRHRQGRHRGGTQERRGSGRACRHHVRGGRLRRRWRRAEARGNPVHEPALRRAPRSPAAGGDVERLYASIGRTFDGMRGWRAVFLAGNPIFAKALRRKPAISHRLWNGPLEARLLVFEL